ncbi:probable myosin-binding protein 5 [Papaver somniferum]|uniref:probable myosin-binding protein 5 n=1 Tax=Papaver somniferum TaxID=3469 RepID=UPI000E6F4722|nr:probable myosin-binding protein 5 [Papaver somniferum]
MMSVSDSGVKSCIMAKKRTFKELVEQKFGKIVYFLINAILEWILMAILFMDGLIAFAANEFARFFDLQIPCLLCTRVDHVLVRRNPDFYYNDSICESHRRDVSSKAFCHVHKRLSDIQQMCEACLLSFATENKPNCDPYKSLVGILGADLEGPADDHKSEEDEDLLQVEKSLIHRCSCCGEPLRVKPTFQQALVRSLTMSRGDAAVVPQAPTPSPRAAAQDTARKEESRDLDLPHIRYAELKFSPDNDLEIPEDDEGSLLLLQENQSREDMKATTVPLLTECEDNEEVKTPSFITNRLFTPTGSATASPRWLARLPRRFSAEKTDETSKGNADGDSILHNLKRQVRFDRKSLIALYMELDEERNASAVAANQAMAMITRLQADKAAIEMEALQYQRMMEEQAEYDNQALQEMKEQLTKREEEIKSLELELDSYRERLEECEERLEGDDYQDLSNGITTSAEELKADLKNEKNYLLDRLKTLEETRSSELIEDEDKGYMGNTSISKEISDVNEKLEALQRDEEFLTHIVQSLKRSNEGTRLLKEIAQHLKELRQREKRPLEIL